MSVMILTLYLHLLIVFMAVTLVQTILLAMVLHMDSLLILISTMCLMEP